jgi:hypothetical protein
MPQDPNHGLQAIIEAAVHQAVKKTAQQYEDRLAEADRSVAALERKTAELLHEKKKLEGKPAEVIPGKSAPPASNAEFVVLSREEARDPRKYRDATAYAKAHGKALKIASDGDAVARPTASTVEMFDDPLEGRTYINQAVIQRIGPVRADRIARERGHKLTAFRSVDDLTPEARKLHDQARRGAG